MHFIQNILKLAVMINTWEILFYLHCHNYNGQFYNYMKNWIYVAESWHLKKLPYRLNVDKKREKSDHSVEKLRFFFFFNSNTHISTNVLESWFLRKIS